MNASRFRELLDLLIQKNSELQVQERLNELAAAINEIVSSPQDPGTQNKVATALASFQAANQAMRESFEPTQVLLVEEIGAGDYFIKDFAAEVAALIRDNPISPAVVQTRVSEFQKKRNSFINQITQLRDGMEALGIKPSTLQPGEAEIGFLLPRPLFNNQLDELIKELRDINRIIRAFSEATIGSAQQVEVREISTSDPLFFFGIDPITIAALGAAVTWALNTWKQVEEIRKVRAEVKKTKVLTDGELDTLFDKKISEQITKAVDAKLDDLIKQDGKAGRTQEQRNDLRWALESIMAHVERGMIVEVRFLPPPPAVPEGAPEGTEPTIPAEFKTLQSITPQLSFPKLAGEPILKIPPPPPSTADPK